MAENTNTERAGRFTKKPVTIDAWLIDFGNKPLPEWVNEAFRTGAIDWCPAGEGLYINTLEGHMLGTNGSWLIKGVQGELYACKPDIFEATYSRASLSLPAAGQEPVASGALVALREAFAPFAQEPEWTTAHSMKYPSKAAQIINAARDLLASEPKTGAQEQSDWDIRGQLAAKLTCWHRLTGSEAEELVSLAKSWCAPQPAAPVAGQEPMFWVRLCGDGLYEGPIHNARIEEVRRQSGAWSPLYLGAAPQPAVAAGCADALPMQPIVWAEDGCIRFKKNSIVRDLLDYSQQRGFGLTQMAAGDYTAEERMQFAQLIGYSVSGYGGLSYVSEESADKSDAIAAALPLLHLLRERAMGECKFDLAWRGSCKAQCEGDICEQHTKVKCCVCGAQATHECDHTGQFVCGSPLCPNCEGFNDNSKNPGVWGFMNHSHRAKEPQ